MMADPGYIVRGALTSPSWHGLVVVRVQLFPAISPTLRETFQPCIRRMRFCLVGAALLLPLRAAATANEAEAEGWQLLAGYLYRDAFEAFERAPAGSRARELGLAASLLNHPPVTGGKIATAEKQLRDLIAADGTDDTAMYARLLLARIAHLHQETPIPEIEAAYRDVLRADPRHPAAQIAASRLALVFLYQRPDLTVAQRLDQAAALADVAGAAALPEAACAYYRSLAGAALFYEVCDDRVLAWLQQADAIGSDDPIVAANLRIQLAEVARQLGRRAEAVAYYRRFLASILPTDNRYLTARERMQELERTTP